MRGDELRMRRLCLTGIISQLEQMSVEKAHRMTGSSWSVESNSSLTLASRFISCLACSLTSALRFAIMVMRVRLEGGVAEKGSGML